MWPALHDASFEALLAKPFDTAAPTELYWATTRGEVVDDFFVPADPMVSFATDLSGDATGRSRTS